MQIRIEPIRAMTMAACEAGHLIWVRECLAGLLVETESGWYLQVGFGPFEAEGLLFPTLSDVDLWIVSNAPVNSMIAQVATEEDS